MKDMELIELKFKPTDFPHTNFIKYFKTWKSLNEFVMSRKINKYNVKSPGV